MTIWRLKKAHTNDKLLEKNNVFQLLHKLKNIHQSKLHLFGQIKRLELYFSLYESPFTFIEKRRPNKYFICEIT